MGTREVFAYKDNQRTKELEAEVVQLRKLCTKAANLLTKYRLAHDEAILDDFLKSLNDRGIQ